MNLAGEPGGDSPNDATIMRRRYRSRFHLTVAWDRLRVRLGVATTGSVHEGLSFLLVCLGAAIFISAVITVGVIKNASFIAIVLGSSLLGGLVLAVGLTFIRKHRH
jgi:hypothetical protein